MASKTFSVFTARIDAASVSYTVLEETGSRSPAAQWALLIWLWSLYESENLIQCSRHGRLPWTFGSLFSLLSRVLINAMCVPSFRGPGVLTMGCIHVLYVTACYFATDVWPSNINCTLHFM